jgi:DNA-binding transcriptional MerR regulator
MAKGASRRGASAAAGLRVGELARRAGLSVRALHHYEAIGLLEPARRSGTGHRLYGPAEVARLARIRALGALGFPLEQVRRCLDEVDWTPLRLVELHLARAREVLAEQQDLCARLERLRVQLAQAGPEQDGGSAIERFLETAEVMGMIERYYTEEQLRALARRRDELGEAAIREVEQAWAALFAEVKAELERGTAPEAPAAQRLAQRWSELRQRTVAGFSGGDAGIEASLGRMYAEQPVQRIHPDFDPAVFAFMEQACAALARS